MKKLLSLSAMAAVVVFVAGCGPNPKLYRKMFFPVNKIVKAGPVFYLDILDEEGVSNPKLTVGESVVLVATAVDINRRDVKGLEYIWECDADDGKLSATEGESVTFTLQKKPSVNTFVEAKTEGKKGLISIVGK
jgi:hypothetical protein